MLQPAYDVVAPHSFDNRMVTNREKPEGTSDARLGGADLGRDS